MFFSSQAHIVQCAYHALLVPGDASRRHYAADHLARKQLRSQVVTQPLSSLLPTSRFTTRRNAGVIFLGDFWHVRASLPVEPLNAALQAFSADRWTCPMIMLPGNHDQVCHQAVLKAAHRSSCPGITMYLLHMQIATHAVSDDTTSNSELSDFRYAGRSSVQLLMRT